LLVGLFVGVLVLLGVFEGVEEAVTCADSSPWAGSRLG